MLNTPIPPQVVVPVKIRPFLSYLPLKSVSSFANLFIHKISRIRHHWTLHFHLWTFCVDHSLEVSRGFWAAMLGGTCWSTVGFQEAAFFHNFWGVQTKPSLEKHHELLTTSCGSRELHHHPSSASKKIELPWKKKQSQWHVASFKLRAPCIEQTFMRYLITTALSLQMVSKAIPDSDRCSNVLQYMDVSKNSGTPKSSIFNRVFHCLETIHFGGPPLFLETPIYSYLRSWAQQQTWNFTSQAASFGVVAASHRSCWWMEEGSPCRVDGNSQRHGSFIGPMVSNGSTLRTGFFTYSNAQTDSDLEYYFLKTANGSKVVWLIKTLIGP